MSRFLRSNAIIHSIATIASFPDIVDAGVSVPPTAGAKSVKDSVKDDIKDDANDGDETIDIDEYGSTEDSNEDDFSSMSEDGEKSSSEKTAEDEKKLAADRKRRAKFYDKDAPNVLMLGGTGVKSHPTTELFLKKRYKITMLNRGLMYWDAPQRLTSKVYQHWKCDRAEKLAKCDPLQEWKSEGDPDENYFDLCIDFSSLKWIDYDDAVNELKGRCKFYINISSFTVYDVAGGLPKQKLINKHGLKETAYFGYYLDYWFLLFRFVIPKLYLKKN